MKKRILTIVGTRPHFVKAAMVSKAIEASDYLEETMVHTGQHYDQELSSQFFRELALPQPKYNLKTGSGRQGWQLGQMIIALDEVIDKEKPDLVIVFGDTNSTAAGAIAAAKNNIPLAHIEAGLREFNKQIPEEVNKLLTDAVTDLFFCPTATGVKNLNNAGITKNVFEVGDVGIDLVQYNLERIQQHLEVLERYHLQKGKYFLMTCHRAANTDSQKHLKSIFSIIPKLEWPVILPLHPRTRKALVSYQLEHMLEAKNLITTPPLGFWDIQSLLRHAYMAITDSGGIIKEAYFHKTPGIIIDQQTEWIESVAEGWNQIAGPDKDRIIQCIREFHTPKLHSNCLGDGTAAKKIVSIITNYLC